MVIVAAGPEGTCRAVRWSTPERSRRNVIATGLAEGDAFAEGPRYL